MDNFNSISFLTKLVKNNAIIAAVLVLAMLGIFILTGIGQDPLQYVHSTIEYKEILLHNPSVLRLAIGLDNAFILFYVTLFLALGLIISKQKKFTILVSTATALIFITGVLDILENMHFFTMISSAQNGFAISENEIKIQVWESLVKFHISYIGLYILSFALPSTNVKEKILCFLLRWVQWPVGMLIYITPINIAKPLVLVRFAFFLTALVVLATINWKQTSNKLEFE